MTIQDLKTGALFNRYTHEYVTDVAGQIAGFTPQEIQVLMSHVHDPDDFDVFGDRFWKHFYEVSTESGGAPLSCDINYKQAVNNNNLIYLSWATHYMEDCGCFFHTTTQFQQYHVFYEDWVDANIDSIMTMIDVNSIIPYTIDNIDEAVIQLAINTNARKDNILLYLGTQDYDALKIETADNIKDIISFVSGLYIKYIDDVAQGMTYPIPVQLELTDIFLIFIGLSLPFIVL